MRVSLLSYYIINQLYKPVNLPVFIIHGFDYLSAGSKDSHVNKGRDDFTFRQDIIFLPVVGRLPGKLIGSFSGPGVKQDFLFL